MVFEGEGDDLDLAELSRASRVSPRTIRYYIHQGLLPSPGKRGRGARYDRGLLDRLRLIQLLQRDAWPLARIADHLAELDEEGVRRELGAPPELMLGDSAAYATPRAVRSEENPPYRARGPKVDVVRPPAPIEAARRFESAEKPFEIRRSTWKRVRVSPYVEISVRTPLSAELKSRVDRLIAAAQKILERS